MHILGARDQVEVAHRGVAVLDPLHARERIGQVAVLGQRREQRDGLSGDDAEATAIDAPAEQQPLGPQVSHLERIADVQIGGAPVIVVGVILLAEADSA